MSDRGARRPELEDDALWLLTEFASRENGRERKLSDVVDDLFPRQGGSPHRDLTPQRNLLARTASGVAEFLGRCPEFCEARGKQGTFPTSDTDRVAVAAQRILTERSRVAAERRALEWIQLASSIDNRSLRIGGYQAHYERFLGRLLQDLRDLFPWVQTELAFESSRKRGDPDVRTLADRYEAGDIDYMLVPEDKNHPHSALDRPACYEYSLRVVAADLRGQASELFPIEQLRGRTLIAAPQGYSSRDRLDALLTEHRVEVEGVIDDPNPLMVRVRALAGDAIAVLPDEYSVIGQASSGYPKLGVGGVPHRVRMRLVQRPGLEGGVHAALRFAVDRLCAAERRQERHRPAALDA